jgi:hypothetical protein
MKITGASIKQDKKRGEWAELRFMARASEQGLSISKPWGDSNRYDFIVEHDGKLLRIQVKSTTYRRWRSYICRLNGELYTSKQIDFLVAYVIPKNVWFIFPISSISSGIRNLTLSPHLKVSKYGLYQEAWHLLRGEEAPV